MSSILSSYALFTSVIINEIAIGKGRSSQTIKKKLTFLVMSSHCVPLPEAGAPDIIIFRGLGLADATTCTIAQ